MAAKKKQDTTTIPTAPIPAGIKMAPLSSGKLDGFLKRPHKDDPTPTAFSGVLRDVRAQKDDPMQTFGVFEAIADQPGAIVASTDLESGEITETPVTAGMMVGVKISGAIRNVTREKIGHFFVFAYDGKTTKMAKGRAPMWNVDAYCSVLPYEG